VINQIPIKVMQAAQTVALKHPNSMEATIYRKVFNRSNPMGETMGGAPTLGGLGVLTPDDEDQYEYKEIGDAKMLIVSRFDGELDTTDRHDSTVPGADMQEAIIAALGNPAFEIKKYDLVAAMPGGGVVIAFEILKLPSTLNIYPFTTKYVIAPRDDLHNLTPWQG
jgi:hypothetical protein